MALDHWPTIVLLRRVPDSRDRAALERAVQRAVASAAPANSVLRYAGANAAGMTYYEWRLGKVTCHIGQCSARFRDVGGVIDASLGRVVEWHDRDAGVPNNPVLRAAWDAHAAWTYVDALDTAPDCLPPLLRLSAELIDDDCLLVWDCQGIRPPRGPMALLAPAVRTALASGRWPD
ncbi:MAG TPA: hypothetical protein VH475_15305 [Tepidisphaeraceae bacterium]|jgi:hypothetical protein